MASTAEDIVFFFTYEPPVLNLTGKRAKALGLGGIVLDPANDSRMRGILGKEGRRLLAEKMRQSTPEKPEFCIDCELSIGAETGWNRVECSTVWASGDQSSPTGLVGRVFDVQEEYAMSAAQLSADLSGEGEEFE